MRNVTMHYLKDILSVRSFLSFFCTFILKFNHEVVIASQPVSQISKLIQVAAVSITLSDFHSSATVTNVQLPGIISNSNNSITGSPPSSQPFPSSPAPLPIIRNTRAPPALGGPTLSDPYLKVESTQDSGEVQAWHFRAKRRIRYNYRSR
jgi:hypothetical protein